MRLVPIILIKFQRNNGNIYGLEKARKILDWVDLDEHVRRREKEPRVSRPIVTLIDVSQSTWLIDEEDIGDAVSLKEKYRLRFSADVGFDKKAKKNMAIGPYGEHSSAYGEFPPDTYIVLYEDGSGKLVQYIRTRTDLGKSEFTLTVKRRISPLSQNLSDNFASLLNDLHPQLISEESLQYSREKEEEEREEAEAAKGPKLPDGKIAYIFDAEKFDKRTQKEIEREEELRREGYNVKQDDIDRVRQRRQKLRVWAEKYSGKIPRYWVVGGKRDIKDDLIDQNFRLEEAIKAAAEYPDTYQVQMGLANRRKLTAEQLIAIAATVGTSWWAWDKIKEAQIKKFKVPEKVFDAIEADPPSYSAVH